MFSPTGTAGRRSTYIDPFAAFLLLRGDAVAIHLLTELRITPHGHVRGVITTVRGLNIGVVPGHYLHGGATVQDRMHWSLQHRRAGFQNVAGGHRWRRLVRHSGRARLPGLHRATHILDGLRPQDGHNAPIARKPGFHQPGLQKREVEN
jgi:hypothetical protein